MTKQSVRTNQQQQANALAQQLARLVNAKFAFALLCITGAPGVDRCWKEQYSNQVTTVESFVIDLATRSLGLCNGQ